jgi:hypothetical protein
MRGYDNVIKIGTAYRFGKNYKFLTKSWTKIDAIRHYRRITGSGFLSARKAIVGYQRRMEIAERSRS